jgi:hypothetical protein
MPDYLEKYLSQGLCVMDDSWSWDKLNSETQPQYTLRLSGNISLENDPLGILHVLSGYANLKNLVIRAWNLMGRLNRIILNRKYK